jgi:hypothetical protein
MFHVLELLDSSPTTDDILSYAKSSPASNKKESLLHYNVKNLEYQEFKQLTMILFQLSFAFSY